MSNLMNKTKAQLVEIIERKDSVESKLREDVKTLKMNIELLEGSNQKLVAEREEAVSRADAAAKDCLGTQEALVAERKKLHQVEVLADDFKEELDNNATTIADLKKQLNRAEKALIVAGVVVVIMAMYMLFI